MLPAICCVYMSSALGRGTFCTGVLSHDTHHHNTHTHTTDPHTHTHTHTHTHRTRYESALADCFTVSVESPFTGKWIMVRVRVNLPKNENDPIS